MADRIALAIEPDNDTANQIAVAGTEGLPGRDHLEWRRRHGVGPHQQAGGDHPERRAAQGRVRDLQQAASQPESARGSAGPDLVRGDAGDLRAAQEAEVARRRIPAEAARGERLRVEGGGAGRDRAAATRTFTSWTPIRTSCCRRMTRTSSSMATTTRSARCWSATAFPTTRRSSRCRTRARRRSRARSSIPRPRRRSRRWRPAGAKGRRRPTTWSICGTCGPTTICRRTWAGSRAGQAGDDEIRRRRSG